jgi:chemosensory pili system protein ChpA (sensor histidine kinase/response regulator)
MTTAQSLAIEPKTITISQYEALVSDIEIAKQEAVASFNYEDSKGDKAARSYIAGLRKIRARIEAARKEAKAYALDYGRAVDGQAKELEAQILGLIEPHQQALDAITQREKDRVAAHEASLQCITSTVQKGSEEGADAETIFGMLAYLEGFPTDGMDEFEAAAETEKANGIRLLTALHAAAVEREKREALEAAEAQRLAAEQEARQKAEEEARQAEAVERGRQEAAAAAASAVAEAEARAKESEDRAALAEADRVAMEAAMAEVSRNREERERQAHEAKNAMREQLIEALTLNLTGLTRTEAASRIVDGSLHPAITVDWEKVM